MIRSGEGFRVSKMVKVLSINDFEAVANERFSWTRHRSLYDSNSIYIIFLINKEAIYDKEVLLVGNSKVKI